MNTETAEALVIPIMEAVSRAGRLKHGVMDHDTHVGEIVATIKARDAAIRREALENIRDVVLDKLIDLFNEMREELEEPK